MKISFVIACSLLVVFASAVSASVFTPATEMEASQWLDAHRSELPDFVKTVADLKKFTKVASIEMTQDGKTVEIPLGKKVTMPTHEIVDITPSEIWQIGAKLYSLIVDNQPTTNVTSNYGGAVPVGISQSNWTILENWQTGQGGSTTWTYKNFLGIKLSSYSFYMSYQYKGDYKGVGEFLTQAGAKTTNVYAYLSEHVTVSAHAWNPLNYGTDAKPVGGLDMQVTMSSHGLFEKNTVACHFQVHGDGVFKQITCGHTD